MAILFYSDADDPAEWREELTKRLPDLDFRVWPDMGDVSEINSALVWLPPRGLLSSLPNLKAVFSLAAGVDAMLRDDSIPDVPLCRMVDPSLTRTMSEYVLANVLKYHRQLDIYARQQERSEWQLFLPAPPGERRVGIMGLGVLGSDAANTLTRHGFSVLGWSRSPKRIENVTTFSGERGLEPFLSRLHILVCLLPLTDETRGILNADLFGKLPAGAHVINVGRGPHLNEADLLHALECGQLAGATLDVFLQEPPPEDHPFWRHPMIAMTPHAASYSLPSSGAEVVAANIERLRRGEDLENVVERARGY